MVQTAIVLTHILNQIERDRSHLEQLPYTNWFERVEQTVRSFVPGVVSIAPDLIKEVSLTLNSPKLVREIWAKLNTYLDQAGPSTEIDHDAALLSAELGREQKLLTQITGDTVSRIISDFLCSVRPDIRPNGHSTYPDLYFSSADYSMLPRRRGGSATGPALTGGRPTSVPDGIEIKSQRGERIRVDCHHPHQGLHLVVTFDFQEDEWITHDVYIAYLSVADYVEAVRNTTATTPKYSFKHEPFISVLTGSEEDFIPEV